MTRTAFERIARSWLYAVVLIFQAAPHAWADAAPPILHEIGVFRDPTPGASNSADAFGWALAMEGNLAVVGMQGGVNPVGPPNAAFVYRTDTQQLLHTLLPPTPEDSFGSAVAISGNLVVVGARFEDVQTPTGTHFNAGAAHVYDLSTGQHVARLVPNDPGGNNFYGSSVAIDGTNVLVGGSADAVYQFNALTGQQLAKIMPAEPQSVFGHRLDLEGNIALIAGAPADTNFAGAAYVWDISTNTELRKIAPPNAGPNDNFGSDIDLDGNLAAIGSVFHFGSFPDSGAAYVYDITTGQQLAKLLPPVSPRRLTRQNFGASVEMDGNLVLVGAPADYRRGPSDGAAFLFNWQSGAALAELLPVDPSQLNSYGWDVAIAGGKALVTDFGDQQRGSVYLFAVPEPTTFPLALAAVGGLTTRALRRDRRAGARPRVPWARSASSPALQPSRKAA